MEDVSQETPAIRNETRNPDGTYKPGVSGNPSGRPKNTLKDYLKRKFIEMSDEEKEEFLKKVQPEVQWKMAEGNPETATDITSGGEKLAINLVSYKDDSNSSV